MLGWRIRLKVTMSSIQCLPSTVMTSPLGERCNQRADRTYPLPCPVWQPLQLKGAIYRRTHGPILDWRAPILYPHRAARPVAAGSRVERRSASLQLTAQNPKREARSPESLTLEEQSCRNVSACSRQRQGPQGWPATQRQATGTHSTAPPRASIVGHAAARSCGYSTGDSSSQRRPTPSRAAQAYSIRSRHAKADISLPPHMRNARKERSISREQQRAQVSQLSLALLAARGPRASSRDLLHQHAQRAKGSTGLAELPEFVSRNADAERPEIGSSTGSADVTESGGSSESGERKAVGGRAYPELAQQLLEGLGLNAEQMAAATSDIERPKMILAGAGTGKTTTLIGRIVYLLVGKGVPPYQVLVVTFTNKAAKELKQRLAQLGEVDITGITVATFHSACYQIVREHWSAAGFSAHPLIWGTDSELKAVLKEAMRWGELAAARSNAAELLLLPKGTDWQGILAATEKLCPHVYARAKESADQYMAKHRSKAKGSAAASAQRTKEAAEAMQRGEMSAEKPSYQDAKDARVSMIALISRVYEELKAWLQPGFQPEDSANGKLIRVGDPPHPDDVKDTWGWLGRQKRLGHRPHEFPEGSEQRGTYEAYQSILRQANALDFDDLLMVAVDLARKEPSIREKLRRRFRYMLVDEFQDSNPLQVALMHELQRESGRLTVVGDDCQAIYGFRGTTAGVINDFRSVYGHPDLQQPLQANYRSRPAILATSCKTLEASRDVIRKELHATKAATEHPVALWETGHPGQEAEEIAKEAKRLHTEDGIPYESMAVLFRNFKSKGGMVHRKLQDAFVRCGVRFHLVRGHSLLDAATVKDTLAYLRLILNPRDDAAFERVLNTPPRGLGDKLLAQVREHSQGKHWDLLQAGDQLEARFDVSLMTSLQELLDAGALGSRHVKGARAFAELVERLRLKSTNLDAPQMLLRILVDSGYLDGYQMILKKADAALKEQASNPLASNVYDSDDEQHSITICMTEEEYSAAAAAAAASSTPAQGGTHVTGPDEGLPDWVPPLDPLRSLMNFAHTFARDWEHSPGLDWDGGNSPSEASLAAALSGLAPWDDVDMKTEQLRFQKAGHEPMRDFLSQLSLSSDQDAEDGTQQGVAISTIHAAKGLEWDYVWVPRLNDSFLPTAWRPDMGPLPEGGQQLSVSSSFPSLEVLKIWGPANGRPASEMNAVEAACMQHFEEERRLLHVACTRARERLYLSYVRRWTCIGRLGGYAERDPIAKPSYFLSEIEDTVKLLQFPPDEDERRSLGTWRMWTGG